MKILGHRGCILKGMPFQNSLDAFKEAIHHTDGFETDACLTNDGDVVFIHEEVKESNSVITSSLPLYLDDTSSHKLSGRILADLSTAEVKELKLKDGQNIPTFEDVLPLFTASPDKTWNIELKGYGVTPVILNKLTKSFEAGLLKPHQIILSSFDHKALELCRQDLPHVKIGALFVAKDDIEKPLSPWHNDSINGIYKPLTEMYLSSKKLVELEPEYIIAPHTELNDAQINLIIKLHPNCQCAFWVCGKYNNFNNLEFKESVKKFAKSGKLATIIVDDILNGKA